MAARVETGQKLPSARGLGDKKGGHPPGPKENARIERAFSCRTSLSRLRTNRLSTVGRAPAYIAGRVACRRSRDVAGHVQSPGVAGDSCRTCEVG